MFIQRTIFAYFRRFVVLTLGATIGFTGSQRLTWLKNIFTHLQTSVSSIIAERQPVLGNGLNGWLTQDRFGFKLAGCGVSDLKLPPLTQGLRFLRHRGLGKVCEEIKSPWHGAKGKRI